MALVCGGAMRGSVVVTCQLDIHYPYNLLPSQIALEVVHQGRHDFHTVSIYAESQDRDPVNVP